MGGLRPSFTKLAIAEAIDLGLTIKCAHISGVNNQESDYWSRTPDKHNWILHPQLFRDIDKLWGPHTIDRFASCQNCHLRRFNSRYWEPLSKAVDALSQVNWHLENNFVNAPFCLLHKVLDVVQTQKAYATVNCPKMVRPDLVPSSGQNVHMPTVEVTKQPKSMSVNGRSGALPQPKMGPVCLEDLWRNKLELKGWSLDTSDRFQFCIAPSTLRSYNHIVEKLHDFCQSRMCSFPPLTNKDLADFLYVIACQ